MTIEKLARKLAPLRPSQVRRWREARALADPELRNLLDQELAFEARRRLGSVDEKLLLSLPPASIAKGRFDVGTILYEQSKWPFGLRTHELLQGLAVFGRAGAGKTNAVFHLLLQLSAQHVPFLFLDWKRTVRHLLPLLHGRPEFYTPGRDLSPLAFSPFMPPPGLEPRLYAHQVVDVLGAAYMLGEGARSLLQRVLVACYDAGNLEPSPHELLKRLDELPLSGRARQWHVSAVRALESLSLAGIGQSGRASQSEWVTRLLGGSTIIELDGLHIAARQFLVPTLFLWLYHVQLGAPRRERLQLVLIIEEAHHVLYRQEHRARESIMSTLLRQCREIGIGVIVVDQHPHLIASAAIGNTFATLCLNQKDPADINKAAGLCLLDEDDKRWLSRLPVGQGVMKMQDRWREAFVVQVPPVAVRKGAVTDDVLRAYLHRKEAGSGTWRLLLRENGAFGQVRAGDEPAERRDEARSAGEGEFVTSSDAVHQNGESGQGGVIPPSATGATRLAEHAGEPAAVGTPLGSAGIDDESSKFADGDFRSPLLSTPLDEASLAFLHDIVAHPDDGVKTRYRRLGWSMSRGTRIKDALVFAGWLESEWLRIGNTRVLLLRHSTTARRLLGPAVASTSDAHCPREHSGRESLTHEYWKRYYAKRYAEQGYDVMLEAPRAPPGKGCVDILARRRGEAIAIEIETGASSVGINLHQNVAARFSQILIVATSPSAAAKVARRLELVEPRLRSRGTLIVAPAMA